MHYYEHDHIISIFGRYTIYGFAQQFFLLVLILKCPCYFCISILYSPGFIYFVRVGAPRRVTPKRTIFFSIGTELLCSPSLDNVL